MVLLQIRTTPLGQGLPSPATLLFNFPVCSIMPVIYRKPISINNDDEHHKNLMHRQGKNDPNNNTSQIIVSILIGSTVVVQQEDGGWWTHGTIIGKGNHNHHNRSYKIQVTSTGRIITHNRQYIKPTPITTEDYMHYQVMKHTRTDQLDAFLNHIWKNPHTYMDKAISNERDDIQNTHGECGVRNNLQGSIQKQICSNTRVANESINEGENIVKTRYGRIVKKPDRLIYQ